MYQKLMTKEIEKQFDKYPIGAYQSSSLEEVYNAPVIAKFFNPCGAGTWFALEGGKMENGDYEMWGYCHLGDDMFAEFGYFYLSELESIKIRPFGLRIERDISVNGKKSLKEEMRLSCITPSFEVKEEREVEMGE